MKSSYRMLVVVLVGVTALKLYLAFTTQGSIDILGFRDHLEKVRELGVAAYRIRGAFGNPFSHPPPMVHVFKFWGWLADATGLPFRFWVRLPAILADVGCFVLVSRWVEKQLPNKDSFRVLLALVLCPASILISGYHGNTDSVMIFLILLSIHLLETRQNSWAGGMAFGLAVCVKVVPLALAPVVLFYLTNSRKRFEFFSLAIITFILCSLPFIAQDPKAIWTAVFAYKSIYGNWGWPLLAVLSFPELAIYLHKPYDVQGSHAIFALILKFITIGLTCAISVWLNRRTRRPSLFLQCGFIMSLVLFMAPGFGTQYLVWPVPFVAALNVRRALLYYVTSGSYLVWVFMCNEFSVCLPGLFGIVLSLICWLSVLVLVVNFRRLCSSQTKRGGLVVGS